MLIQTPISTATFLAATLLVGFSAWLPGSPAFAAWGGNAQPPGNRQNQNKNAKAATSLPLESLDGPRFVTAVVSGGHGQFYVASEDSGVYRGALKVQPARQSRHPSEPLGLAQRAANEIRIHAAWKHYDKSNSPGLKSDFITALCVDSRGRLWCGTDKNGICVFNGKKWKHYGIVDGPLGCHVYAIAFDEPARQIWIATEDGLSVYQCGSGSEGVPTRRRALHGAEGLARGRVPRYNAHTWHYLATAGGPPRQFNQLPPNPDCMAFDARGRIFVGTQCGGLAIGTPRRTAHVNLKSFLSAKSDRNIQYTWRIKQGPWHTLTSAYGAGLPSNLINAVRVNAQDHVFVATDAGLSVSRDDGESFRYIRGADYAAKILGLWHPPADFQTPSRRFLAKLLPGDHITALAQDAAGNFWIGAWRKGFEVLDPRTQQSYRCATDPANPENGGYVSAFCPITIRHGDGGIVGYGGHGEPGSPANQIMLVAYYGSGVWAFPKPILGPVIAPVRRRPQRPLSQMAAAGFPKFPKPAAPPTAAKLTAMLPALAKASHFAAQVHFPYAVFMRDDWATEGDWTGRYGRELYLLCSTEWGLDFSASCDGDSAVHGIIGPHHYPGDTLREWQQWADTNNPRSLYIPQLGYRRECTWDDHGEVYSPAYQGPDVWLRVHLKKAGLYRVSLYFFNKDGHSPGDEQRDFPVQVYSIARTFGKAATVPLLTARTFPTNRRALAWAKWAMRTKPLAEGRVVNFWGGVYLRFLLAGPGQYMIRLDRNASLDTIVQAVFIDPEIAKPDQFTNLPMAAMGGVQYQPPAMPHHPSAALASAISVWRAAQHAFGPRGVATRRLARLLCYRYAVAHHAPANLLANWRWHLDIWKPQDRKIFDHTMNEAFRARLKGWKGLRAFMEKDGDLQPNSGEIGHE